MYYIEQIDRFNLHFCINVQNRFSGICSISLKIFLHMKIFLYNPNSESKYFFLYIEESFSPFLHSQYLSFVPLNTLSTTPLSALGEHLCMIKAPLPTGFLMGLVNEEHWHEIRRKKESEVMVFIYATGWLIPQPKVTAAVRQTSPPASVSLVLKYHSLPHVLSCMGDNLGSPCCPLLLSALAWDSDSCY